MASGMMKFPQMGNSDLRWCLTNSRFGSGSLLERVFPGKSVVVYSFWRSSRFISPPFRLVTSDVNNGHQTYPHHFCRGLTLLWILSLDPADSVSFALGPSRAGAPPERRSYLIAWPPRDGAASAKSRQRIKYREQRATNSRIA
jgi:hypothetical protein